MVQYSYRAASVNETVHLSFDFTQIHLFAPESTNDWREGINLALLLSH